MLFLLACTATDDPTPPTVLPEDTGASSCPVLGQWPVQGSVVPPDGSFHALLSVEASEDLLSVTGATGTTRAVGHELSFVPDEPLAWDTRYTMTVEGCEEVGFRTPPDPGEVSLEVGTTWSLDLNEVVIGQPVLVSGVEEDALDVVLEVLSVAETVDLRMAGFENDTQLGCPEPAPGNRLDGGRLHKDLSGEIPVAGPITSGRLSAALSADGRRWEAGMLTFEQDERALDHELCEVLESFAGACAPCDDGEVHCVRYVVGDLVGQPTSLELEGCDSGL